MSSGRGATRAFVTVQATADRYILAFDVAIAPPNAAMKDAKILNEKINQGQEKLDLKPGFVRCGHQLGVVRERCGGVRRAGSERRRIPVRFD